MNESAFIPSDIFAAFRRVNKETIAPCQDHANPQPLCRQPPGRKVLDQDGTFGIFYIEVFSELVP